MSENTARKKRNLIYFLIYLILILIFIYSLFHLVTYFTESKRGKDFHEELLNDALVPIEQGNQDANSELLENLTEESLSEQNGKKSLMPDISIDIKKVKSIYKDCVGWIYCPNTCINYPVMQGNDNDYYLHKLPNGTDNFAGSIFMDFQDNMNLSGFTTTIYGHNLKDQSMFTPILKYRKDGFYEDHPHFFYFSEEGIFRLEVFSGVNTTATSDLYRKPATVEEFDRYLSTVKKKSCFSSDVDISSEDKIIRLSTCSGGAGQEYRFLLFCKIVPIEY